MNPDAKQGNTDITIRTRSLVPLYVMCYYIKCLGAYIALLFKYVQYLNNISIFIYVYEAFSHII